MIVVLMVFGYLVGKAAEYVSKSPTSATYATPRYRGSPAATAREIRRARKAGRLVLK